MLTDIVPLYLTPCAPHSFAGDLFALHLAVCDDGNSQCKFSRSFYSAGLLWTTLLEPILFIFVLGIYVMSVLGNGIIIVVSCMDVHLHTPMYFFLVNLSFLDISFTTSIVPQLLVNLWGPQKTISYGGCVNLFYVFIFY